MANTFWGNNKLIAIAHRGGDGAGKARQNSLDAFSSAWKHGIRYAEADVLLAASGEVVVVHGSHNWLHAGFGRGITNQVLQKMTLDQIRYIIRPGDAQVPLLEDILTSFPKMKFVLDIKTEEVIGPLVKKLKKQNSTQRVCLSGYNYKRTLKFTQACQPDRTTVGLTMGRGLRFRNMNKMMLKTGRLSGVDAIFIHHSLVSAPMLSLIHNRGFKAVVWTANSKLAIKHAIRSGADGIISDRINLLQEVISSNE